MHILTTNSEVQANPLVSLVLRNRGLPEREIRLQNVRSSWHRGLRPRSSDHSVHESPIGIDIGLPYLKLHWEGAGNARDQSPGTYRGCLHISLYAMSQVIMIYQSCKGHRSKTSPAIMSSIPTTELLVFNTTEEFRKDHSILYPTLDLGLKSDGVWKPAYCGVQIEDPATGYMIVNWDSLEKHMAIVETPLLQTLLEVMKPVFEGSLKTNHIIFNDHTTAFQQPVTEVLLLTPKDPSHRAEMFDILTKLSDSTKQMLVFGPTLEDDNEIVVVGGWPSVEAHWETVAHPEPKAALERLYTIANKIHHFHTSLTPYSGK